MTTDRAGITQAVLDKIGEDSLENLLTREIQNRLGPGDESTAACNQVFGQVFRQVFSELEGFGPIESLLGDPSVSEVLINDFDTIFFEKEGRLTREPSHFVSPVTYDRFVKRILMKIDRMADRRHPVADGNLDDGTRVHVVVPPLTKNAVVSLRRHCHSFWSLDELQRRHFFSPAAHEKLRDALETKKNILICGPTGAGKTTLLRALINEIDPSERIVTVEDTDEIGITKERGVRLLSRVVPENLAPPIYLADLLRHALRMRPDRIIVGEIRGDEAMVFLDAISTGHRGSMSSLHAHSARQAIGRLENLVSRAAPQWPISAVRQMIYEGVEVIVGVGKKNGCRRISEISEIAGIENFGILLNAWPL